MVVVYAVETAPQAELTRARLATRLTTLCWGSDGELGPQAMPAVPP